MQRQPTRSRPARRRAGPAVAVLAVVIVLALGFLVYWITVGSRGGSAQQAPPPGAVAQRQSRMGMIAEMRSWRNAQDGMFHCPVCDAKFRLPGQIRAHMAGQHPDYKTTASAQPGARQRGQQPARARR